MGVTAARRTAFNLALRVERDGAFTDELLHSGRMDRLRRHERAFVTELVLGSLRRRGELDYLVSGPLSRPLRALDLEVLTVLRHGAYQLRHMQGVPPHAAVHESVELVRRARKASAAPLVNAVLRRLPPAPPEDMAARLSHPGWLVRRWTRAMGERACGALLRANLRRPGVYFRVPAPTPVTDVVEGLRQARIGVQGTDVERSFRLVGATARDARAVAGADIRFQDINAQQVAGLLAEWPGNCSLDVCAAPGGKARLLAEHGTVVAGDRHLHRLRTLRKLGSEGIAPVVLDAGQPLPFTRSFQRVLVDAPCSGTGTLRRNPEIKWRLQPKDLVDLQARQLGILSRSLDVLAPRGTLVYATCSLEAEENADVVEAALRSRRGWTVKRALATVPGSYAGDGFQAWRIQRPPEGDAL